jgi:outer membrane biosynthesis protein TonB
LGTHELIDLSADICVIDVDSFICEVLLVDVLSAKIKIDPDSTELQRIRLLKPAPMAIKLESEPGKNKRQKPAGHMEHGAAADEREIAGAKMVDGDEEGKREGQAGGGDGNEEEQDAEEEEKEEDGEEEDDAEEADQERKERKRERKADKAVRRAERKRNKKEKKKKRREKEERGESRRKKKHRASKAAPSAPVAAGVASFVAALAVNAAMRALQGLTTTKDGGDSKPIGDCAKARSRGVMRGRAAALPPRRGSSSAEDAKRKAAQQQEQKREGNLLKIEEGQARPQGTHQIMPQQQRMGKIPKKKKTNKKPTRPEWEKLESESEKGGSGEQQGGWHNHTAGASQQDRPSRHYET